ERYFNDLAQNRIPAITKALNTTLENVKDALLIIKGLEPHPGSSHGQPETNYVIPDVTVEKIDGEYVITLRNDRLPSVRVSRRYIRMFNEEKRKKRRSEVRKYLKEKLDAAFLLLKSIEKRQSTLYRVTESIVKHQRDFFEYGLKYMKPMTLKDVAEDIEVHESTVSRVTTQKYVECCRGVIELKYFFTSSIGTTSGEDASARSVKLVIKEIVAAEDTAKPLSDQKISDMLKTRGFTIARRTVSKYREQLRILPGKQRMKY
ncbi:MAG: RNA polymerase factor sigma-54, partial [Candidatus Lindowbacteria bacterium]|nr:RNA polymerase factor sigma-54 [Candidatus Lindowbacteria bacterium]